MPKPTHYQTLGVPASATDEEVRKAFQAVARLVHSDVQTEATKEEDAATWDAVQAAYNAIKTPALRRAYDKQLSLFKKKCGECGGTGSKQQRRGFKVITIQCPACWGEGKQ